ncbi:hypothetical protein Bca101_007262 [Brassica carinata]
MLLFELKSCAKVSKILEELKKDPERHGGPPDCICNNCAESDTTVPDSPARAKSWNLLKYGEILEDLKNDPKSHGEILEDFSLTKLPRSFS